MARRFVSYVCLLLFIPLPGKLHSGEQIRESTVVFSHEAEGLRSEVTYSFHHEDSTIDVNCNLKNISGNPIYFAGYPVSGESAANTYKDYFRIEYGAITKFSPLNGPGAARGVHENVKSGFYDDKAIYVHLLSDTFFRSNHVLSQGWCFRSELKPGGVFAAKVLLKVDCRKLTHIYVSIDFAEKNGRNDMQIGKKDIKIHRYRIPLQQ